MYRNPENYSIYVNTDYINTSNINCNNYENVYYKPLINMMLDHIEDRNIMTKKYKILFTDNEEVVLNVVDLFINLTLWHLPIISELPLTSEYFIFTEVINNNIIASFMDNIIQKLLDKKDRKFINNIIADTIIKFNIINEFSFFIANTISVFDIVDLTKRSPNITNILNTDLYSSDFVNIKEDSDKLAKEFFNEVSKDKKSVLYDYIKSGEGFSRKQFKECLTAIGVKPDGFGGIFKTPIYNSFLNGGCNNPLYYRIDAATARISQIIIESNVGTSGDFSNRLSYNNIDTLLHPDPAYICDTKNYNTVTIEDEKDLNLFVNRYYRFIGSDIERCISENDKSLIGKTIEMRTPMKCASFSRGQGVCHRCYGKLSRINSGLNIGKIASDILSSSCTQPQLSSKHILEVKMFKYDWCDTFNQYLKEDSFIISVKKSTSGLLGKLIIDPDNIEYVDISSEEDDESEMITVSSIEIENEDGEIVSIIPQEIPYFIMLSPLFEIIEKYTFEDEENGDELIIIPLSEIEGEIILSVPILNNDLINIINNCKKYISTKAGIKNIFGNGGDLSTLSTSFRKAVINDAELKINPLHLEVILASQIYEDDTCIKRVDWSIRNPKYVFVDLKHSLKNNPSVVVSLINGYLSNILNKPSTFIKKSKSIFDPLYTDSLYDYYNGNL